jgi:hypothetical protein
MHKERDKREIKAGTFKGGAFPENGGGTMTPNLHHLASIYGVFLSRSKLTAGSLADMWTNGARQAYRMHRPPPILDIKTAPAG